MYSPDLENYLRQCNFLKLGSCEREKWRQEKVTWLESMPKHVSTTLKVNPTRHLLMCRKTMRTKGHLKADVERTIRRWAPKQDEREHSLAKGD